jgi:hypothetical protein
MFPRVTRTVVLQVRPGTLLRAWLNPAVIGYIDRNKVDATVWGFSDGVHCSTSMLSDGMLRQPACNTSAVDDYGAKRAGKNRLIARAPDPQ